MLQAEGHTDGGEHAAESPGDEFDADDIEFDPDYPDDDDGEWLEDNHEDGDEDEPAVHKQAVAEWGDQRAQVDCEMAPLISEIWRAGFQTFSSCQDVGESLADLRVRLPHMASYVDTRRRRASLDMSPSDVQPLLDMVAAGGASASMYDRMTRWTAEGAWAYGVVLLDLPDDRGDYRFRLLAFQVSFPRSDIEEVTECLRLQIARHEEVVKAAAAKVRSVGAVRG